MISRFFESLAPTTAAALLRISQLGVLVGLGQLSQGDAQLALLAGFGVLSSFMVISDSGSVNYLLSREPNSLGKREYWVSLRVQSVVGAFGVLLSAAYVFFLFADALEGQQWLLVVIAVSQAIEGMIRVARSPLLWRELDGRFALIDFVSAVAKISIVLTALTVGSIEVLYLLPCPSLLLFVFVARSSAKGLVPGNPEQGTIRKIAAFGLAGASSALYSQTPLLIGAAFLPLHVAATLSISYRIVQATEILPATLAQQALPRLVRKTLSPGVIWIALSALGCLIGGLLWTFQDLLEFFLDVSLEPALILLVLLVSMPAKYGNYALSAVYYATQRAGDKATITVIVGLLTILLSSIAVANMSAIGVVSSTLLSEAILAVLLVGYIRKLGTSR